tara:strand:+ start:3858 stop:4367 length:510 start_codon:yes stop_codon:yes gene_type:complete
MKLLKFFTKGLKLKTFLILLIIILIPNILRQVYYFVAVNKFNSIDYIASFETQQIFSSSFPFLGFGQEIIIGLIYVFLWYKFKPTRFLTYGWITDALIDFISVFVWVFVGFTPIQLITTNPYVRFFLREILFSYLIFGILLAKWKPNVKKLSMIYTLVGIIMLLVIIFI